MTKHSRGERLYRALLRAYPVRFRESYEHEMVLVYRNQRRDGVTGSAGYWTALLMDVARSAPRQWRDVVGATLHPGVRLMKGMAIVAVLVAAFELVNAIAEVVAGGVTQANGADLVAIAVAIVAPFVLLAAGVSLIRRGRAASQFGIAAAAGCILSFAFLAMTHPMLSGLAILLGTGFPFALLVFLLVGRGRGTTGPVAS